MLRARLAPAKTCGTMDLSLVMVLASIHMSMGIPQWIGWDLPLNPDYLSCIWMTSRWAWQRPRFLAVCSASYHPSDLPPSHLQTQQRLAMNPYDPPPCQTIGSHNFTVLMDRAITAQGHTLHDWLRHFLNFGSFREACPDARRRGRMGLRDIGRADRTGLGELGQDHRCRGSHRLGRQRRRGTREGDF
ncbi:hypothetical protein F5X68DRAFT_4187 [Plectosphaerella plurivora]|uniref:Uncharacterized protein n=1 Tax=Plectosphaerella plurivora TaxID=936078 RepID=A0A9P8VPP1_9PEZI|nr:hypothetical protein F5X68DRAFT_4187 [Plectosphaerella plurivora]